MIGVASGLPKDTDTTPQNFNAMQAPVNVPVNAGRGRGRGTFHLLIYYYYIMKSC